MKVDHEAVAKSIYEMISNGASYQMIGNYLALVYRERDTKIDNSWDNFVDRQSGAFTKEEIDDKHQGNG